MYRWLHNIVVCFCHVVVSVAGASDAVSSCAQYFCQHLFDAETELFNVAAFCGLDGDRYVVCNCTLQNIVRSFRSQNRRLLIAPFVVVC